ncbi:hypothetical protein FUAX_18360 [Fulvitalea axinellae]|uniref:Tail sheath protein C-terminal domain-containing protein n=1 Tax=Fulvitalea axinellae TaxID=1182444 RepID=A0AAU9CBC1_9BACT|nr:hypothetical protein FUAX_18360 [Fulvitalea axinellae]
MAQMKTPGVYIKELNAFPNSVVEVSTAVPAFIGYTERAENAGKPLDGMPVRITSLAEFNQYFGGPAPSTFTLAEATAPAEGDEGKSASAPDIKVADKTDGQKGVFKGYDINEVGPNFRLYNSIRLFYQNGGGPCYIVSIGNYSAKSIDPGVLTDGLNPLVKEMEPTMLIIPELTSLESADDAFPVQQAMLGQCQKMQSRISILDVFDGFKERDPDPKVDVINVFRNTVGTNALMYGAAYYPWLHTTIVQDSELGLHNLDDDGLAKLKDLLTIEQTSGLSDEDKGKQAVVDMLSLFDLVMTRGADGDGNEVLAVQDIHNMLITLSPAYNSIITDIKNRLNLLPPSSAMAGIMTMVDATRGVWKAPANVSVNSVIAPTVNISHDEQQDLNVTLQGKSINAIRSFIGEGVLVWGARTLDGNSQDWRYINVRRTMIMLEQSIKAAAKAFVFEPNVAGTWITIKGMIENFLYQQWKNGALAGSQAADAYSVSVGLGSTMTANDILDGIMRITVLVAISRPAEFIEITFQQQMQKS